MSPRTRAPMYVRPGFPRVSGDEPPIDGVTTYTNKFSPRERG